LFYLVIVLHLLLELELVQDGLPPRLLLLLLALPLLVLLRVLLALLPELVLLAKTVLLGLESNL
jgi:hypothetical protein